MLDAEGCACVYALFSGGHDSLCSAAIAAKHPLFRGVVHLNTGIGIEETREFVRETCDRQGWPLTEVRATDGLYEKLVLERGGFPSGTSSHNSMLFFLKQQPLRAWCRTIPGKRIGLVIGIRREESVRRMGAGISVPKRLEHRSRRVWLSPILDWTALDCSRFMGAEGLPRNPVVDLLHRSGECLCGALARPGEINEISQWFPDAARRINDLERRVEEAGIAACVWASPVGRRIAPEQESLFSKADLAPLCSSCEADSAL